jgi:A/G-specific adenine glycosylase
MDHGATVCLPAAPKCSECPVAAACIARAEGLIDMLPVRARKPAVRTRYFHYLLLHHDDRIWLRLRRHSDIWNGLYEPLLIEAGAPLDRQALLATEAFRALELGDTPEYLGALSQKLSHQRIESRFFLVHTAFRPLAPQDGIWVSLTKMKEYPFQRTHNIFFEKKG